MSSRLVADRDAKEIDLTRRISAEALGSGLLSFFAVAGAILAERHSGGTISLVVLMTALSVSLVFGLLAQLMGGVAPALFSPLAALVLALDGRIALVIALLSAAAQIAAAYLGVMIAHLVTNSGLVQAATQIQTGAPIWTGELIAAAFFALAILAALEKLPTYIGIIGGASLFAVSLVTPSMSFANPAMTLARTLTDSFTSIRLEDATLICGIQLLGGVIGFAVFRWLIAANEDGS